MAGFKEPKAIQILEHKGCGEYEFNEDALSRILLDSEVQGTKVMIIAGVGSSMKGNSFLLNVILRYLRDYYEIISEKWMDFSNEPVDGFPWKHSNHPVTNGIVMWDEPFYMYTMFGKKVCILLMDVQGLDKDSGKLSQKIFLLSSLIASVLIWSPNLSEFDMMEDLKHMADYHNLAWKTHRKLIFQNFRILFRDWSDKNYSCGLFGALRFLNEKVKEIQKKGACLPKCQLRCFLMPDPGSHVKSEAFQGNLSDEGINPDFKVSLTKFVDEIFIKLQVREILGNKLTGREMFEYIKAYCNLFKETGEQIPKPEAFLKATHEARYISSIGVAENKYRSLMDEPFYYLNYPYLDYIIDSYHEKSYKIAMTLWRSLLTDEEIEKYKDSFKVKLFALYNDYKKEYKERSKLCMITSTYLDVQSTKLRMRKSTNSSRSSISENKKDQ